MNVSTTYHFPAPRWRVIRANGWSLVIRLAAAHAGFRDHADAIAWADRKARGQA